MHKATKQYSRFPHLYETMFHNTNLSLFTFALSNLGLFPYFLFTWRNWKDINSKEIVPKKYNVIFVVSVASEKEKKPGLLT